MIRRLLTLTLALALILCALPVLAENGTTTVMYVYTDNGQGLNVRRSPFVGNNIIGLAPYASKVYVIRFLDNGWACIQWNQVGEAYVQSRFLQWNDPRSNPSPVQTPVPTPTPAPTSTPVPYYRPTQVPYYYTTPEPYTYTDTLATLNAEFRTARIVAPFTVVVRPSRASGWVNMRWAPSKDTEVLATYRSGAQLTVIAETQSWYQVADPNTEATGFIMKTYVTRQY
jgi:uncharacterized protein YgiM (DUF1202 family)